MAALTKTKKPDSSVTVTQYYPGRGILQPAPPEGHCGPPRCAERSPALSCKKLIEKNQAIKMIAAAQRQLEEPDEAPQGSQQLAGISGTRG